MKQWISENFPRVGGCRPTWVCACMCKCLSSNKARNSRACAGVDMTQGVAHTHSATTSEFIGNTFMDRGTQRQSATTINAIVASYIPTYLPLLWLHT